MQSLREKINSYLKTLPIGKTTTYKFLAEKFHSHPRAIGKVLATNTDKSVPCYKVIRSDGKLGGYNGLLGKSKKELIKKNFAKIKKMQNSHEEHLEKGFLSLEKKETIIQKIGIIQTSLKKKKYRKIKK